MRLRRCHRFESGARYGDGSAFCTGAALSPKGIYAGHDAGACRPPFLLEAFYVQRLRIFLVGMISTSRAGRADKCCSFFSGKRVQ